MYTRPHLKSAVFALFAIVSLIVGCLIPSFYDWTGANQSRSTPIVGRTAIGILVAAALILFALPWFPVSADEREEPAPGGRQFNMRVILIITTVVAMAMALFPKSYSLVLGNAVYALSLLYAIQFCVTRRQLRWRVLTLLACMYLPFAWVVNHDLLHMGLELILGLPVLVPMLTISHFVRQHPEALAALASALAGFELVFGIWTIRRGPRWSIAFHLLALLLSTFGSFALNALTRM